MEIYRSSLAKALIECLKFLCKMYEFVGAAVGRSVMIEGTINSVSLINSILGMFMISFVSSKTQEDPLIYLFVMFKFSVFWMMISSVLGCISYCWQKFRYGKIQVDMSSRTRAWFEGPHLSPWMRATREVGSIILSFLPLLPEYQHMIENGIGYFRLSLLLSSLWGIILVSELYPLR